MIGSARIERAEKILGLVYQVDDIDRQLTQLVVDREAFDNFAAGLINVMYRRYPDMDPRFEPGVATLLLHSFLVGILCGRGEEIV